MTGMWGSGSLLAQREPTINYRPECLTGLSGGTQCLLVSLLGRGSCLAVVRTELNENQADWSRGVFFLSD